MAQQLNLYDASLRPQRVWITPTRLLLAAGGLLALMALAGTWMDLDARRAREQAAQLQVQLRQLQAGQQGLAGGGVSGELLALREQLAQARRLAEARATAEQAAAPAGVLAALAAAAPGDLWLQRIQWQAAPAQLTLEGGLLQPARLPAYLRRLEAQPAFGGLQFQQLQMAPLPEGEPHARFALRSQVREGAR